MPARNLLLVPLVLFGVLLAAACSSGEAAAPVTGVTTIEVVDRSFEPPAIQVTPGTAVSWTWNDGASAHDVTGDGFESGYSKEGDEDFVVTFDEPGEYEFECSLHPDMKGRVVVAAPPGGQ